MTKAAERLWARCLELESTFPSNDPVAVAILVKASCQAIACLERWEASCGESPEDVRVKAIIGGVLNRFSSAEILLNRGTMQ